METVSIFILIAAVAVISGLLYLQWKVRIQRDYLERVRAVGEERIKLQEQQIREYKEAGDLAEKSAETLRAKAADSSERIALLESDLAHQSNQMLVLDTQLKLHRGELKLSQEETNEVKREAAGLRAARILLDESQVQLVAATNSLKNEYESKLKALRFEKDELASSLAALKEKEPIRMEEHRKAVEQLGIGFKNIDSEREKERIAKEQLEAKRLADLRATWSTHETAVEEQIRLICQSLAIDYLGKEKFPFAGKPDNAVKILNEYIIFDSKSPQGEDLGNFPSYIRTQAEASKKYLKSDEVKKDIYFVVPTNAIQTLPDTFINLGSHRVHVIAADSLLTVLLHLQKIENYEFAEQLSPEDREKIHSVIGKMMYGMKRRIQIDQSMAYEFITILSEADNLPEGTLEESQEVERSMKLNPKIQSRGKRIDLPLLLKEQQKIDGKISDGGDVN